MYRYGDPPPAAMTVYDGWNWVKGLALAGAAVGIWVYLIRTAPKR